MNSNINNIYLPKLIGKGYKDFWEFKGRYRICKGSRASKKSKTTALYYITKLMQYKEANLLVVRKVFSTLRDSCYKELKWAITQLNVDSYWDSTTNPLEITYRPTGQKIYFRGLDDPLKITSITVEVGFLCWCWIEEAYEIMDENAFNMLDESIRGKVSNDLFKQLTLTFNPWNERHWIKHRFFDEKKSTEILSKTTNYLCNEFLDDADRKVFERMKKNNPRRYQVAGLGNWGIIDGLVYENWEEKEFDVDKLRQSENIKSAFGLDFGYTNDPSALFCGLVNESNKIIYVFDEMYKKGYSNERIKNEIKDMGYSKERITADSQAPKDIDHLRELGLINIKGSRKGKGSVNNGIQYIQDYKIVIHPRCVNFLTEISNYTWDKDKFGKVINKPVDDFNHLLDAMRYALEDFIKGEVFSFE